MKHLLPVALALFISITAAGQRVELQPTLGVGITNAFTNPISQDGKPIIGYTAGVGITLKYGRLQITTGLAYLTTGYGIGGDFILTDPYGQPTGTVHGTYSFRYTHLGIPIMVGYSYPIARHLSFIPSIGLMPTYNTGARERLRSGFYSHFSTALPKERFDAYYSRFTLFGCASARFRYTLSKDMNVFAGPAFRGMITSIGKTGPGYHMREREFAVTVEGGMGFTLR